MKLQTSIPPRRDGTITVIAKDGQRIVFAAGPDGELVGDVTDEPTVAELLDGGLFFPANPADFDAALALTGAGADDDDDNEGTDDESVNALPIESNTPPAPPKPAAKRAAAKTAAAPKAKAAAKKAKAA